MLDEAWAVTTEPLVCNQIEVHPFINQDKVLAASKKHGMAVVAYVPIARGKVPGAEALERIGKAHGKSAAQVSLRYLVQLGCCSIPRTAKPAHMKENLDVFDFKLWDGEMAELKKLNATNMRVVNPPHAPVWERRDARRAVARLPRCWRRPHSRRRKAGRQRCRRRSRNASRPQSGGKASGKLHRHRLRALHR